ncbi:MAG TPA: GNAT family N-acetyltransferase [Gemmataceae bacterium]|nr:GNAT family N-acetyltransferase [Gemmataceae bacterium]
MSFHPLTPERWPDVEKLFGERGACGGCWCMTWRLPRAEWEAGRGEPNKAAFRAVVEGSLPPGVLAYSGGEPIGWCAVAPREVYVRLEKSRVLARVDDLPVWSISCLFIAKPFRRQGVSIKLIGAASEFARSHGARVVEAYPVVPNSDAMPAAFAWTGTVSAYERAGFREVARRSEARPIMRRDFKARRLNRGS